MIWFFGRKVFVGDDFERFENRNAVEFCDREEEESEKYKLD